MGANKNKVQQTQMYRRDTSQTVFRPASLSTQGNNVPGNDLKTMIGNEIIAKQTQTPEIKMLLSTPDDKRRAWMLAVRDSKGKGGKKRKENRGGKKISPALIRCPPVLHVRDDT